MPPEIEPGVQLSGHLISAEIGRGGFSRVFRAEPTGGGAAVAIKVAVRPELVAALKAEGVVLRRLQGPRFVRILEEHLEEEPPYFVLELCEGGDLRALLDRSPGHRLPPAEVERIMEGILEGVAFAHEEGVVHGDLKPENILLDAKGAPKIADLGLSRADRRQLLAKEQGVEPSVASGEEPRLRGTFDYLAPETRKGSDISPASDVYALGVLLYELLTGKRPLGVFQLPRALLAEEGVEVPRALDRVVARALAHDTSERYPDASLMLADLRAGDEPLRWTVETSGPSRAPRIVRVEPIDDYVFAAYLYGALVVPLAIFFTVNLALGGEGVPAELRVSVATGAVAVLAAASFNAARSRGAP